MRVESERTPFGVGERTPGRSLGERRGVLDAPGDPAAAWAPKGPVDGADKTEGDPAGPLTGRHREDGISDSGHRVGPLDGARQQCRR